MLNDNKKDAFIGMHGLALVLMRVRDRGAAVYEGSNHATKCTVRCPTGQSFGKKALRTEYGHARCSAATYYSHNETRNA